MKLSEELQWRGFINQTTLTDITDIDRNLRTFYWGVDPSADSMQIGNFAAAMMVRHFINHGHKAVLLVGGATGMIGDPDGKADERNLKTLDEIANNKAGIAAQYNKIFDGMNYEIVDNYDWFKEMNYLDFLRNVGKYMSMTQLLDREFVQSRIGEGGSGISYAEFSYSLIQGYDFLHLYRENGVTLQVCGADQWGNSITGAQLVRKLEGGSVDVFSTPLVINKTTGVKFGKSEGGAIWLDPAKTSPYKFYQFWLNVDDAGVIDYMKIYTLLSLDEIEAIAENHAANPGARSAQRALAANVTDLVHGVERRESVERVNAVLFGQSEFESLSNDDFDTLSGEIVSVVPGKSIIDILTESGQAKSASEARRLIEGGAVSLNGARLDSDVIVDRPSLLKKGKNNFVLIRS